MSHLSSHGFIFLAFYLLSTSLFGQIPTFQKAYVGEFRDNCLWGIETTDGFLLAGRGRPLAGGTDGLLIKTDKHGNLVWSKNYGGGASDWLASATKANDGGYIAYGINGGSSLLDAGVWLVKVDSMGGLLWQKTMGDSIHMENPNMPIISLPDGYVISGFRTQSCCPGNGGAFTTKINNYGETLWSRLHTTNTASDSSMFRRFDISYATDSALYAIGVYGKKGVVAAISPSDGGIAWACDYQHGQYELLPFRLLPTIDGNLVFMGLATPLQANEYPFLWIAKIRADGQLIWSKRYDSTHGVVAPFFSNLSDGGFIVSFIEPNSIFVNNRTLMKLDIIGDILWKKNSGPNSFNLSTMCFETSDGGIASFGGHHVSDIYNDDFFFMKTDSSGEIAGCCSEKRDFLQPVDFPIEIVPASYIQEDYLTFAPINLTPPYAVSYSDTNICTISVRPTLHDTLRFCPGESVTLGGTAYDQPATVSFLIPSASDDCDTLARYTLEYEDPDPNSTLQLDCPADITVQANGPVPVQYPEPTAWSDCNCPDLPLVRTGGPASGSLFSIGGSTVCYRADDACGNSRTCCFTVSVMPSTPPPADACDTKTNGCLQFELLEVNRDYAQNWAYHVRLTNSCADAVRYAYLQVPKGLQALAPINNIVYTSTNGHTFTARNPNFSPFYSVRFHFAATTLANGQSETFRYVLPQQADVKYIHAAARLFSGAFVETHLNTFSCPVGTEPQPKPEAGERGTGDVPQEIKVYPNPVTHELALTVQGADAEGGALVLFDLTGRVVIEGPVQGGRVQLGGTNLPNGMYFFGIYKNGRKLGSGKLAVLR